MAGVPQHPARCTARDAGVRMRRVNKRRVNRRRNEDRESGILKCVSARALSSGDRHKTVAVQSRRRNRRKKPSGAPAVVPGVVQCVRQSCDKTQSKMHQGRKYTYMSWPIYIYDHINILLYR